MSGSSSSADVKARAEARFQLAEQRKSDAEKVMGELKRSKEAEAMKTARLRALRLAKEEADSIAEAAAKAEKVAAASARKTKPARSARAAVSTPA